MFYNIIRDNFSMTTPITAVPGFFDECKYVVSTLQGKDLPTAIKDWSKWWKKNHLDKFRIVISFTLKEAQELDEIYHGKSGEIWVDFKSSEGKEKTYYTCTKVGLFTMNKVMNWEKFLKETGSEELKIMRHHYGNCKEMWATFPQTDE
jgi:hypothetical protein